MFNKIAETAFYDELQKIAINLEQLEHIHLKPKAQSNNEMLEEAIGKVYGPQKHGFIEGFKRGYGSTRHEQNLKAKINHHKFMSKLEKDTAEYQIAQTTGGEGETMETPIQKLLKNKTPEQIKKENRSNIIAGGLAGLGLTGYAASHIHSLLSSSPKPPINKIIAGTAGATAATGIAAVSYGHKKKKEKK